MLTWQERAPRQQMVDLRANEAGSGRCEIAAMSGDVRQGSWHQLGLFDVFKVTIISFWGFRIPNGQDVHVVGRQFMP